MTLSRRNVLKGGALMAAGVVTGTASLLAQSQPAAPQPSQNKIPDRGPRLDSDLVRQFVIAGHGNLDVVKEMLAQQPALINATWDWGGGDWETALGGASHMGNKPIAEYLLAHGARMDVFCSTMLGKTEIVKAFLADDLKVVDLKGPHGIPLVRHAQAGKQEALVEMLVAAGAKI
ncbi:MAG TPA: ankyrin repeat domain-containing protein [Thermoanaerobaculia bacterium]|nr:ankyrin repeat domain-containing protein [Thermoanaerobaculia bacterium]